MYLADLVILAVIGGMGVLRPSVRGAQPHDGQERRRELVVAGDDATVLPTLGHEAVDAVAWLVNLGVVADRLAAVPPTWDHRPCATHQQVRAQPVGGVTAFRRDEPAGERHAIEKFRSCNKVAALAPVRAKASDKPRPSARMRSLVEKPPCLRPSATTRLRCPFGLTRASRVLVRADYRGSEHLQVLFGEPGLGHGGEGRLKHP